MKKFTKVVIFIAVISIIYFKIEDSLQNRNEIKLANVIKNINKNQVTLEEIVPFKWDKCYTFKPYTSKNEIKKYLNVKNSSKIKGVFSEGLTQFIFLKDDEIVCSVFSYPEKIGYSLNFYDGKNDYNLVNYGDNSKFNVEDREGIIYLSS